MSLMEVAQTKTGCWSSYLNPVFMGESPLRKMIGIKEVFYWTTYYLDNHSLLALSFTCRTVRAVMEQKQLYRKAAWSLCNGVPFDLMTDILELDALNKRINIKFPELILAFGSLQKLSKIPHVSLSWPITMRPPPDFEGSILRGTDSESKVFLAFRLLIKNPFKMLYEEQVEVIYQDDRIWKRVYTGLRPHLTLGIAELNAPAVSDIFISRLRQLLAGGRVGVAEERPPTDPLSPAVPYRSGNVNGPFSTYVTL